VIKPDSPQSVLHVVVGHGLRTYFLNAVRSVRDTAPNDEILVVDNASPDAALRVELGCLAAEDPHMRLLLRDTNDLTNGKVGGLYDAYRDAFALAIEEGFEYVHLLQGDMQVLWWDDTVIARAAELFDSNVRCVNVFTCLFTSNRAYSDDLDHSVHHEPTRLRHYGLTDTGLYHLGRWKELEMAFAGDESEHARTYLEQGFTVLCHPWPTDAQIPWPAVVRRGVQSGKEIFPVRPFLLRPLSADAVAELHKRDWTWLEDVCVPWGWTCLKPMWTTDLGPDYWAARRQDAIKHGLLSSRPRWERRGLDGGHRHPFWRQQYRPPLVNLFILVPLRVVISRLTRRLSRVPQDVSA
jgi:hypothetical protein